MLTFKDIETWYDRHFNGTTPGTELHAVLQRAKADLHKLAGTVAPEPKQEAPAVEENNQDNQGE